MIIDYACKIVFRNPSDEGQVRVVSGGSAGTWANIESATFANCAVTPTLNGSTGDYEFSLPTGLSSTTTYIITVYDPAAVAFNGTRLASGTRGPGPDLDSLSAVKAKTDLLPAVPSGSVGGVVTYGSGTGQLSLQSGKVVLANDDHGGALATFQMDGDGGIRASRTDMGTVVTGQLIDVANLTKTDTGNLVARVTSTLFAASRLWLSG